jgi:hypothetical protein
MEKLDEKAFELTEEERAELKEACRVLQDYALKKYLKWVRE